MFHFSKVLLEKILSQPRTNSTTQAHILTGNQTRNPSVWRTTPNQGSHTGQGGNDISESVSHFSHQHVAKILLRTTFVMKDVGLTFFFGGGLFFLLFSCNVWIYYHGNSSILEWVGEYSFLFIFWKSLRNIGIISS